MIIAIAPYIIIVRSYMESEPIVAMSNEKPIRITTAIAPYASQMCIRDSIVPVWYEADHKQYDYLYHHYLSLIHI